MGSAKKFSGVDPMRLTRPVASPNRGWSLHVVSPTLRNSFQSGSGQFSFFGPAEAKKFALVCAEFARIRVRHVLRPTYAAWARWAPQSIDLYCDKQTSPR